ncbi:hypothetical protein DCAR_0935546 [Daucus carota subsp. sativus]|uniref:Uncharacterized protein n=1 Tax=Daucus carota subsp. sativus TaxID=79200 RepID=A0A175YHK7_DAUCS|nr:PREDICTED: J protein JJJ2-like [Daucus carota subsp. sativus]XP_017224072.1 PREDICTED: J protein JJJ2-like [Daucus carota subsp. sativus]XP_017224073.1 PREDICTED: J protein JJJ2-like [Daucus carota subsp. sativus]WOH15997.1 hypothetical protein DCAR_0935546 [Daucus carota subsp. sativus]
MECNRDEAARSKAIAERKLIEKDFAGAKKFAMKAHNLYPCMDGISQLLATIDVYVFSEKKLNGEADWYGVLGVNPRDSEDVVRKKYRKLVLTLHPDKNKAQGADGAFILVSEAWDVLSDKTKRSAYDKKIFQPQCGGSWIPPAPNSFYNSKNGSNIPKDSSNAPVDKQKPVPTESPFGKEKPTAHPPHKCTSTRKQKPSTVPPPGKKASYTKEKQPTVPPLRKHASSSEEKPATVPPPHKAEPGVAYPSSNIPKPDSVSSHKGIPPSVSSPHKHKPSTIPNSSCKNPAVTLSSHRERRQTVLPTHKYNSSTKTVHVSSYKKERSTMHAHEEKPRGDPVTSPKRKRVPGTPDQSKEPKQTAGFLSRCNGCKMQFEYPRINMKQTMICPNCGKLVYHVKKGC